MRKLRWIITIPFGVVCVVFALANQHVVMVDLWPFAITYELPLFLLGLGSLAIGILLGMLTWLVTGKVRAKARRAQYRASDLEREVNWLRRKQDQDTSSGQSQSRVPESGQLPVPVEPPKASTG